MLPARLNQNIVEKSSWLASVVLIKDDVSPLSINAPPIEINTESIAITPKSSGIKSLERMIVIKKPINFPPNWSARLQARPANVLLFKFMELAIKARKKSFAAKTRSYHIRKLTMPFEHSIIY